MKYIKHRPTSVKVMGRFYRIMFVEATPLPPAMLGMCDRESMQLFILKEQHPVEEADTLLHEILHTIWGSQNMNVGMLDEEPVVSQLATGLNAVLMDNPKLLKYLSKVQEAAAKDAHNG